MKRRVRLTEGNLRRMVYEAVQRVLWEAAQPTQQAQPQTAPTQQAQPQQQWHSPNWRAYSGQQTQLQPQSHIHQETPEQAMQRETNCWNFLRQQKASAEASGDPAAIQKAENDIRQYWNHYNRTHNRNRGW